MPRWVDYGLKWLGDIIAKIVCGVIEDGIKNGGWF